MAVALAMRQVQDVLVVVLRLVLLMLQPDISPTVQGDAVSGERAVAVPCRCRPSQVHTGLRIGVSPVLAGVALALLAFTFAFAPIFSLSFSLGGSFGSLANMSRLLCLFTACPILLPVLFILGVPRLLDKRTPYCCARTTCR